jgi:hypothetical protein
MPSPGSRSPNAGGLSREKRELIDLARERSPAALDKIFAIRNQVAPGLPRISEKFSSLGGPLWVRSYCVDFWWKAPQTYFVSLPVTSMVGAQALEPWTR